ncbi:MAG: 4Fe-4S ferredoxin, partial [Clostridia bacterium]|nr:4Fe-4S ferredoxin [Clostridia bacterium]
MNYSVTAVYFSPTDTSRRGVCAMAEVLGGEFSELDLTHGAAEANFGEQELVIFGGPVYGGRLYKGQLERMAGLKGNNTPCVLTV